MQYACGDRKRIGCGVGGSVKVLVVNQRSGSQILPIRVLDFHVSPPTGNGSRFESAELRCRER